MQSQAQHHAANNRFAVLGAGVIGLSCAYQLQRQGYQVTLYDPELPGSQCSFGNAGHFATEQVFPMACSSLLPKLPKMLLSQRSALRIAPTYLPQLLPWLARFGANMMPHRYRRHTEVLSTLNSHALGAWQRLLANDYHQYVKHQGSLLTFESTTTNKIKAVAAHYSHQGVDVSILKRAQVKELEPALTAHIDGALYFEAVGHSTDPGALSQYLFSQFCALGGHYRAEKVTSLTCAHSHCRVSTATSRELYRKAVVCTGAWSKVLCQQLGYALPLEAERGYHYQLSEHLGLKRPVASFERQFIMTPMSAGLRLAGTVEFAGLQAPANMARAHALLAHARELLPQLGTEFDEQACWQGARPSLPDSLPVIGAAPRHPSLLLALGHQHLGLTQAAITSELIAALINQQPTAMNIDALSIARFQGNRSKAL